MASPGSHRRPQASMSSPSSHRKVPASMSSPSSQISAMEWDGVCRSLSEQGGKLHSDQWKLVVKQISFLVGATCEMRDELNAIKESGGMVSTEVEASLAKLLDGIDQRDKANSAATEHIAYLEKSLGESADKHVMEMRDTCTSYARLYEEHRNAAEERMSSMELAIHDEAADCKSSVTMAPEVPTKQLQVLEDSVQRIDESHNALQKALCESVSASDSNLDGMGERIEHMQKFITEFFDKYTNELEHAQTSLQEVDVRRCSEENYKVSIEKRLDLDQHVFAGALTDLTKDMDKRLLNMQEDNERAQKMLQTSFLLALEPQNKSVESRMDSLEHLLVDSSRGGLDLTKEIETSSKEIEMHFQRIQDDSKNARDMLKQELQTQFSLEHASYDALRDQIREQLERDERDRQVGFDDFKVLIAHEKASREVAEQSLDHRLEVVERSLPNDGETCPPLIAISSHRDETTVNMSQQSNLVEDSSPGSDQTLLLLGDSPGFDSRVRSPPRVRSPIAVVKEHVSFGYHGAHSVPAPAANPRTLLLSPQRSARSPPRLGMSPRLLYDAVYRPPTPSLRQIYRPLPAAAFSPSSSMSSMPRIDSQRNLPRAQSLEAPVVPAREGSQRAPVGSPIPPAYQAPVGVPTGAATARSGVGSPITPAYHERVGKRQQRF